MDDYQRRLAAAQAEMDAAGLDEWPNPTGTLLMRVLGEAPRPWPYLPLGVRMVAYTIPYTVIWIIVNFLFLWHSHPVDIAQAFFSTIMVISLFSMLMLGYEMRRWHSVGLSRWEDL